MNGYCYFILGILILAAGYFTYGRVLEKIFRPDASRQTPAVACTDGVDYVVMPRWRRLRASQLSSTCPAVSAFSMPKMWVCRSIILWQMAVVTS